MEELLKIAKENYPVGTVFKSAYTQDEKDVENCEISENNGDLFVNNGFACIYYKGIWATIISKPKVKEEDMNEFLGLPKEETMTLLEEAKKRFPVGTKFVPAHIDTDKSDRYCIIVKDGEFVEREGGIIFQTIDGEIWVNNKEPKFGNTWWDRAIYYQGNWARIIEEPKTRIVESLNECKAEDFKWEELRPGIRTRTFGQIKEDNFFKTATESLCKMLEAKNKAYGESALKPLDIFAKHHPYGSRLDEKVARVKNSSELRKNDVADIIGGLFLICKDKGWNNFEDLID